MTRARAGTLSACDSERDHGTRPDTTRRGFVAAIGAATATTALRSAKAIAADQLEFTYHTRGRVGAGARRTASLLAGACRQPRFCARASGAMIEAKKQRTCENKAALKSAANSTNVGFLYTVLRRRLNQPKPRSAEPRSVSEAGSGTPAAADVKSIVRLALPAPVAVIVYTSCNE